MTAASPNPRIVFLLGAGFSASANLPTSIELAREFGPFIRERADGRGPKQLKFLHFYIEGGIRLQRGKMGLDPSDPVNIEEIAIAGRHLHNRESSPLAPFVSGWHPHLNNLVSQEPRVIEQYLDCFYDFLSQRLGSPDATRCAFIDRIAEIAAEYQELDVFTLNYDNCVERALEPYCRAHPDLVFVDGFSANGWQPQLFTESFEGKRVIRFYKLHGGLDWIASEEFGLINKAKCPPNLAEEFTGMQPHLVFGTDTKLTGDQPFFTMAHFFYEALMRADVFVVIGYSFGDAYINALIKQAGRNRPKNDTLLIDRCANSRVETSHLLQSLVGVIPPQGTASEWIENHRLRDSICECLRRQNQDSPF
jgi:hypothetical protein